MAEGAQMAREAVDSKDRDGDGRGTPPGQGTIEPEHGGRIGNPPFEPTEAMRRDVEAWAKAGLQLDDIAILLGKSTKTISRHFASELTISRIKVKAAIGAGLTRKALNGNLTAQIFWLRTRAKWNVRVEHTGADNGPIRTYDLSALGSDEKRVLLAVIDQLLEQHVGEEPDGDSAGDQPAIN